MNSAREALTFLTNLTHFHFLPSPVSTLQIVLHIFPLLLPLTSTCATQIQTLSSLGNPGTCRGIRRRGELWGQNWGAGGRNPILTQGAPDRLASGGVQHGLLSGNADLELHGFHLGPVELGQKRGGGRGWGEHYRQTKGGCPGITSLIGN